MRGSLAIRLLLVSALTAGIVFAGLPTGDLPGTSSRFESSSPAETAVKSAKAPTGYAALKVAPSDTVPAAEESSREQIKQGRFLIRSDRDAAALRIGNESHRRHLLLAGAVTPVARQVRLQV